MAIYDETFEKLLAEKIPYCKRISIDDLDKFVRRRQYRDFVERFKAIISCVRQENMLIYQDGDQDFFTRLFELWFRTLAKPGFEFAQGDEVLFHLNGGIANLLAATPLGNGDDCLRQVLDLKDNMAKVLLLYTPRSRVRLDVGEFFRANATLASLWYTCVWNWADMYVDPVVLDNCRYFLDQANSAFEPYDSDLVIGYFRSTYVENTRDRFLKRILSDSVGRFARKTSLQNTPDPKSVAVVSSYWNGTHAVYRAFEPYIRELGRHYKLTLVDLNRGDGHLRPTDPSLFQSVIRIQATNDAINVSPLLKNDFQIAYYPDMGMSQESIYLANMRLAPIQCMGTGHPVTSACREMDYFISGAEVETRDRPEDNYDERLVLLPGLSTQPAKPDYKPEFLEKPDHFIINLPWMHMKNNLPMAEILKTILDRAKRDVHYSIFPGCAATRNSSHMATIQDYARILPRERFFVHPQYVYPVYMRHQERGRFTMHSHPFGGGTTAVDSFIIGVPLTVFRGRHEYNRFSAALLERIGMRELVAESKEEWIEICLRLIDDEAYLEDVTRRVRAADLDALVFKPEDAGNLKRAFDTLIAHHESFKQDGSRKAIEII